MMPAASATSARPWWRRRSLGGRLSRRLALLTLLVLAWASVIVFGATTMAFSDRQTDLLMQKQWQLRALLTDGALSLRAGTLRNRIDDFLIGHPDMSLTIVLSDGRIVYERSALRPSEYGRQVHFSLPALPEADTADILLRLDTAEDHLLLHRIGLALVVAALGSAVLAAISVNLLIRRGLGPVRDLAEQIRTLTADTLHRQLDGSGQPEELEPLIDQFNGLLTRLDRAYEQLESFNADVAHELGTPLSTLIASSELALRKARTPEDLRATLAGNLEDLQRIAAIIRDMLFLSHADRGAQARRTPVQSLAKLAWLLAEFHEAELEEAGLALEVGGDADGAFDIPLLQRAISNLLSNVSRHARRGTTVRMELASAGDEVSIIVVNEGETIPPEQQRAIFDRFFRAEKSRSAARDHHGLGLAIVAAIARMHGGRTLVRSTNGRTAIGIIVARGAPFPAPSPEPPASPDAASPSPLRSPQPD